MQLALTQASIAASQGEVPVGAVLVRDKKKVATAITPGHTEKEGIEKNSRQSF